MLVASAKSPAMLRYLDQASSRADGGRLPNENYAREVMELHTVGVGGGYDEADIKEVAYLLTGWTPDRPDAGTFTFRSSWHNMGPLATGGDVLGWRPDGLTGLAAGESFLVHLARHPEDRQPPGPQARRPVHRRAHQGRPTPSSPTRPRRTPTTTRPSPRWCARCSPRRSSGPRPGARSAGPSSTWRRACAASSSSSTRPRPANLVWAVEQPARPARPGAVLPGPPPTATPTQRQVALGRGDGVPLEHGVLRRRWASGSARRPSTSPASSGPRRRPRSARPSTGWPRPCCARRSTRPARAAIITATGHGRERPVEELVQHPRPARLRPPVAREPGQVSTVSDAPVAVPLVRVGGLSRRRFLAMAGGTAGAVAATAYIRPSFLLGEPAGACPATGNTLVQVFLRGGADGLSLVPPLGDSTYQSLPPGHRRARRRGPPPRRPLRPPPGRDPAQGALRPGPPGRDPGRRVAEPDPLALRGPGPDREGHARARRPPRRLVRAVDEPDRQRHRSETLRGLGVGYGLQAALRGSAAVATPDISSLALHGMDTVAWTGGNGRDDRRPRRHVRGQSPTRC